MPRCLPFVLLLLLTGCAGSPWPAQPSQVLPAADSALVQRVEAQAAKHSPGDSGLRLLSSANEAFSARAELAREAQVSLDLQYYIVHDGLSTRTLTAEVLQAADRGVRVRILLDDTTSDGQDYEISLLAAHPNVQIRVFNPLHLGRATTVTRLLGRAFHLSLQHRRMHNKLWLADNRVAIVGGRNLGDEYFDAEPGLNFTDIDLLAAGPVAQQLGESFDAYWNDPLSQPIQRFLNDPPRRGQLALARQALPGYFAQQREQRPDAYARLHEYQVRPRLDDWLGELIWAPAQAYWDPPQKVLSEGAPDPSLLMTTQLAPALRDIHRELLLISAYFVPAETGVDYFTGLAQRGVRVRVLTNSLEATDVPAVHGGYAPYRRALLESGVELHELRRQPDEEPTYNLSGSSESSLHSKAVVMDRRRVFIGSLNFDPRSVLWNTEVGVLVDSRELAQQTRAATLEGMTPALSYEVRLQRDAAGNQRLVWLAEDGGQRYLLTREPGGLWRRFNAWFARVIGLERML